MDAVVDVTFEESYWYPDDGGAIWFSGYQPVDRESGRFLGRAAPELAASGVRVAPVAGVRHQPEALDSEGAAPGRPLELRRDHGNEHDANAVAVCLEDGGHLGWVPRDLAAELAPELDAGRPWSVVALRESRPSPREPRRGVTMLLAPADSIELRQ